MATYLQGVTDYIPEVQPFQPDLNFYKGIMDTKESQYKAGYDKISNIYGQLINSPLTRDINGKRREQFFNQINNEIQKLSGVDLSLQQNVDTAYKVFQPLINDNNVMKDMAWTKNLMSQYKRADGFRNCTDEKRCGGKWWEGGVQALDFMKMDFANASDEEAMGFGNAKYTPYIDVTKKALEMAKEMGFNVQSVSFENGYIVTEKNGKQMIAPLTSFFNATLGNDPAANEYYKTLAYLERKNYSYGNAEKFGSEENAERMYLNEMVTNIDNAIKEQQRQIDEYNNKILTDKQVIEEKAKNKEIDPDDDMDIFEYYESLNEQDAVVKNNIDKNNEIIGLIDKETLLGSDISTLRNRVDAAVAGYKLNADLQNAALMYAKLNNEVSVEVDQYALEKFKFGLDMAKMAKEDEYKRNFERFKVGLGIVEDSYGRKRPAAITNRNSAFDFSNSTEYKYIDAEADATAKQTGLLDVLTGQLDESTQSLNGARDGYIEKTYGELQNMIKSSKSEATKTKAKNLLTDMFGGKQNVDRAIKEGVIDSNFNIVDPAKFQATKFYAASADQAMQRAMTAINNSKNVKLFNSAIYSELDGINSSYSTYKILNEARQKKYDEAINAVKSTLVGEVEAQVFEDNRLKSPGEYWKDMVSGFGKYTPIWSPIITGIDIVRDAYAEFTGQTKEDLERAKKTESAFIKNLFDDSNRIIDKDAYIARNVAELRNELTKYGYSENFINNIKKFTERSSDRKYDQYVAVFKKEFESGRIKAYDQGVYTYQGAQEATVDGANWQSEAFNDALSSMQNFNGVRDQEKVKLLNGAKHDITALDKEGNDKNAESLFNSLYNDLSYGEFKPDDPERPIINFIGRPIAMNDVGMTGYTFRVNEDYLRKHKGTDTKPGKFAKFFDENDEIVENADMFTMYIPKDLAENSFIEKSIEDPISEAFRISGNLSLNFGNDVNLNIKKISNTKAIVEGTFKTFDPRTGKYIEGSVADYNRGEMTFNPMQTKVGTIYEFWYKLGKDWSQRNSDNITMYKSRKKNQ